VGEGTLSQYRRRLNAHERGLKRFLADHRIPYLLAPTDLPLETLIHERMRSQGVLK